MPGFYFEEKKNRNLRKRFYLLEGADIAHNCQEQAKKETIILK
jgi:hypothetical protein